MSESTVSSSDSGLRFMLEWTSSRCRHRITFTREHVNLGKSALLRKFTQIYNFFPHIFKLILHVNDVIPLVAWLINHRRSLDVTLGLFFGYFYLIIFVSRGVEEVTEIFKTQHFFSIDLIPEQVLKELKNNHIIIIKIVKNPSKKRQTNPSPTEPVYTQQIKVVSIVYF